MNALFAALISITLLSSCRSVREPLIAIQTPQGTIVVELSRKTPAHRENFLRQMERGTFDTTFFHRVIPQFVIQGGIPDSLYTTPKDTGVLMQQRLAAEWDTSLYHFRGAFGMGRDDNALKASFFDQFYIVTGRRYSDAGLDSVARRTGRPIPPERRAVYKTSGGLPRLDGDYVIIGRVIKGMEVVDSISHLPAYRDLPLTPVPIKVRRVRKSTTTSY